MAKLKYWFVSYQFNAVDGFGFGNCWVSGEKLLDINSVQKWVTEREKLKSARVLWFTEVPRAQYIHGLANLKLPTTMGEKENV